MTRDGRQELCLDRWEAAGHKGTVEAFTGFGKTRIAVKAIKRLRRRDRTRTVIVVVPKIVLKEQWEQVLTEAGEMHDTRVMIINSVVLKEEELHCNLVIFDEIHRIASDIFKKALQLIKCNFKLGLTARITRLDGKHSVLEEIMPICDRVPMEEGRKYGWTSNLAEYNLGIEMEDEEKVWYYEKEKSYYKYLEKFKQNFGLMMDCLDKPIPIVSEVNGVRVVLSPPVIRLAKEYGWAGNTAVQAERNIELNKRLPRGQKISVWGNDTHQFSPNVLRIWAVNGLRLMQELKTFIYHYPEKVAIASEILHMNGQKKTIVFCEVTEVANKVFEFVRDTAVIYHTKVEKPKRVSKTEFLKSVLKEVFGGLKRILVTAKALDEGVDWPEAEWAIDVNRTSNPLQHTQRKGRPGRKLTLADGTEKLSTYVNIYVKGTMEVKWLDKAQDYSKGQSIIRVDSLEEIFEAESERVGSQ